MDNLLIGLADIHNHLFIESYDNIMINEFYRDINTYGEQTNKYIHLFILPFKLRKIYSLCVTYKYIFDYYNLNNAFHITQIEDKNIPCFQLHNLKKDTHKNFLQGIYNSNLITDMVERKSNISYLELKMYMFKSINHNIFNMNTRLYTYNIVIGNKL